MSDALLKFFRMMDRNTSYIKMELLKDGYSYKIWARNAYVGIWVKKESGFLISRYKVGKNPYLFTEFHEDYCVDQEAYWGEDIKPGLYGTVKPLKLIEKCPFELKDEYTDTEKNSILKYLDESEENNPIIKGFNSLQNRKNSAIEFGQRLNGKVN